MSDFFIAVLSSAMLYFVSLVPIEYAYSKTKKTKMNIVCLVAVAFGILSWWVMSINKNTLHLETVNK